MICDIACQQIGFPCSGSLHDRTDTVLFESPHDRPVSRFVMRIKLHMSSGQEAFNIAFIRNGQPMQFKVQCFRQESAVCHDPEIEISIPFI